MPKPPATEWLLARVTTPARAAAILGDLIELSATRGRLWFWTAYASTLVSLGWRTPAAIVAAIAFTKYLRRNIFRLMPNGKFPFNGRGLLGEQPSHFSVFCWTVSWCVLLCAWIVFPYVAIRFGVRNRLTYLAGALFLLALPMYTFRPQVYQLTGLASALVIVAALASPLWRRQMIFLVANCAAVYFVFYFCIVHPLGIFRHGSFPVSVFEMRIDDPVAIAITVMIGPPLYRWLLQPRSTKVAHA